MDKNLHRLRKFAWVARAQMGIAVSCIIFITAPLATIYANHFSSKNIALTAAICLISIESIIFFKKQLKTIDTTTTTDYEMTLLFQSHDNSSTIRWILLIACIGLLVWQLIGGG